MLGKDIKKYDTVAQASHDSMFGMGSATGYPIGYIRQREMTCVDSHPTKLSRQQSVDSGNQK